MRKMLPFLFLFTFISFVIGQGTVIDDFETDTGNWEDPNYSGSTTGVTSASSFTVSTDYVYNGSSSGKLLLIDDTSVSGGWFVRMTNRDDQIAHDSKIGFWLRAHNQDVELRFVIWDNGTGGDNGYEAGSWFIASAAEDDWEWVELDLANDPVSGWITGNGEINSTDYVTIESIQLQSSADVSDTLYIDDITEIPYTPSQVNITFQVNMSTYPAGATDSTSTIHVRGSFNGWSDADSLTNDGGDYWSTTIGLTVGESIEYKFTHTDEFGSLTWESISNRTYTVPPQDTVMDLAYWNDVAPFTPTDSIDVWFRLNMAGEVGFDTSATTIVGVRGDTPPLDWGSDLELSKESDSYFYSGLGSFSNGLLGDTVQYKFVYDPGTGTVWETVDNRTFTLNVDTTLAWKWFSDAPPAGEIDTFNVTFTLNTCMLDNFTDSTRIGFVTGDYDNWIHFNDTLTTVGDYSSRTIQIVAPGGSKDIVYKFLYEDDIGNVTWESVSDRPATIVSDTSFFHYWDDVVPFTPTDDIDVWFRVNMEGEIGFDTSATTIVGVRGDTPPLDWGSDLVLSKESDSYYYSGLGSFSNDSLGNTVQYKFVYDPGTGTVWETVDNRTFTLNVDTTLSFKYFSDIPPSPEEPVTAYVYWSVDMAAYELMDLFSPARDDTMQVRGGFNGWSSTALPDGSDLIMIYNPVANIYELSVPLTAYPGTDDAYKYYTWLSRESFFIFCQEFTGCDTSWYDEDPAQLDGIYHENPPTMGAGNRSYTFVGDTTTPQVIGLEYYNDIPIEGVIPDGHTIDLTFTVDMDPAVSLGFDAAEDTVWMIIQDSWAAYLQDYDYADMHHPDLILTDPNSDMVYEVTFPITGYTPYSWVYTYEFGDAVGGYLQEGGGFDYGRYRCRYIQPVTIHPPTWPTSYTFPPDTWTSDPPLVVEDPPTLSVDENNGYLPTKFTVSQNFPNPFNPITNIRFTLPEADDVTFTIYNVMGQAVVTYKRHFPGAGNYGLQWNGNDSQGIQVSSGIYIYELKTSKHRSIKKMTLLR